MSSHTNANSMTVGSHTNANSMTAGSHNTSPTAFQLSPSKGERGEGPLLSSEMTYTASATRFAVWSPMAEEARVNLYNTDLGGKVLAVHPMQKNSDGTWSVNVEGDKQGIFYTFQVKVKGKWLDETPGIFAKAVGNNGQRGMVMDLRTTDPAGWENDKAPLLSSPSDIIIYEMHHRDFSVHETSGIVNKGKFLALTEKGTKNADGLSTGIDHLKQLGITHVHMLPSYDYGSIDEKTGYAIGGGGRDFVSLYNWGYDPVNYNVPEGSYSSNAGDPSVRIWEFKKMVQSLHKAGIRVFMDVVYNHVFDLMQSNFQRIAPGYFFRWQKNGEPGNASGCGNETASEMPMMRKYMVESVLYWMKEYHIDGFRFDLMGIHDIETMNAIREAAQAVDPNVFIYGEGWAAGTPQLPEEKLAMKANTSQLGGIAAFGDEMRDGLRGGWTDDKEGAFLIGNSGNEESVKFGIVGAIEHPDIDYSRVNYSKAPWATEPTQMISYVSCHDDMCITDRLVATLGAKGSQGAEGKAGVKGSHSSKKLISSLIKLAETAVLTSQGVPFIWCGDEIMRDRKGVHNCYASPDSINAIDWSLKTEHKDVFDYVKGLIALRKAHPAFRMGKAELIRANLDFLPTSKRQHNAVAFHINGKAVGDSWEDIIVILNANRKAIRQLLPSSGYTAAVYDGMINVSKPMKGKRISVPAQSALILYK